MIVYLSSFVFSIIGIYIYKNKKRNNPIKKYSGLFILSVLPLAVVSAVRWNVGTDFPNYLGHANTIFGGDNWRYNFEFGYDVLVKIIMTLTHNSQFVIVVTAFTTVYFIWWSILFSI